MIREIWIKMDLLSIEDFDLWSDNIEKELKPDPTLMQKARKATQELWESTGLKPGIRLTKEQFIDGISEMSLVERAKSEEGRTDNISF